MTPRRNGITIYARESSNIVGGDVSVGAERVYGSSFPVNGSGIIPEMLLIVTGKMPGVSNARTSTVA